MLRVEIHIRAVITLIVFFFLSSLFSSSVFKVDDERCASEAIGFYLNPRSDLSRRFRQLFVSWEVFSLPLLYLSVLLHQLLNFLQSSSPQNIVSQEMGEYAHTHSKLKCIRWIILFFFETPSQYLNFNTDKLRWYISPISNRRFLGLSFFLFTFSW